ncbi:MAG: integrase [Candidatus Rokubacteria bacterium]|nr:integrase [Candidatus Rokubacteria bacterium]
MSDDVALTAAAQMRRVRSYYDLLTREPSSMNNLTTRAECFLQLKQDLGMRFRQGAADLRGFVDDLGARGIEHTAQLTTAAVDEWRARIAERGGVAERGRVRVAVEFLGHLEVLGQAPACRLVLPPIRRRAEYRPYIFDLNELRLIFACAERPGAAQDRAVAYTLLYACGLRVGEAARLRLADVDLRAGTVLIERGKSNRDRLLPLHARMVERLGRFRAGRRRGAPTSAPFFVDRQGGAYTAQRLSTAFRSDLLAWGMYRATACVDGIHYGSPRVHALRHSFAVHRLVRWYREGADVQAKLPLLSTYLGHAHLAETQVYLKTTALLLHEAQARFAGRWEEELPLES